MHIIFIFIKLYQIEDKGKKLVFKWHLIFLKITFFSFSIFKDYSSQIFTNESVWNEISHANKKNFMRQFVYFGSRHYTYIPKLEEENKTHLRGYGKEID